MSGALAVFLLFSIMVLVPWLITFPPAEKQQNFDAEKLYWRWTAIVIATIYLTLGPAQVVAQFLREQNLLRITIIASMLFFGSFLFRKWMLNRPGFAEVGLVLGIVSVYLMTWLRFGNWESRTHLFEYGLVSLLIYQALLAGKTKGRNIPFPAVLAILLTAIIGWADEGIQYLLPNRVYDLVDVGFNALAGGMAVLSTMLISWIRRR